MNCRLGIGQLKPQNYNGCFFKHTRNKQLLSNFSAQIGADPKQTEAPLENGVAYKKTCSVSLSQSLSNL